MPIIDASLCEIFNKVARDHFAGMKSDNKLYISPSGIPATKKGIDRSTNRALAHVSLTAARDESKKNGLTVQDYGKWLFDTDAGAGNCYEYACLVAFFARQASFTNVYIGQVNPPGDHAFCVIGNPGDMSFQGINTINGLKTSASRAWVVDPWANTVAKLSDYPDAFAAKMKKWSGENKRIHISNSKFTGWAQADSTGYLNDFRTSPLTFAYAG